MDSLNSPLSDFEFTINSTHFLFGLKPFYNFLSLSFSSSCIRSNSSDAGTLIILGAIKHNQQTETKIQTKAANPRKLKYLSGYQITRTLFEIVMAKPIATSHKIQSGRRMALPSPAWLMITIVAMEKVIRLNPPIKTK